MMDNPPAPSVAAEIQSTESAVAPREGWVALLALLAAMLTVAFAVDDAAWAGQVRGSRVSQTHFLPLAVGLSVLVGFLLAKTKLGRLANHFLGAAIGTAFLLVAVSSVISTSPSLEGRLYALSLSLGRFYHEAFELGIRSSETSVFLLMMGTLLWAAGQFAAFAVFRYHRPLPALIVPGAILLANMSVTIRPQYMHLIVFAAAALVLAVRLNLSGQREGWRDRRIVDGGQLSGLFMRSGAIFVALTVSGSILLAANASSAPLARVWRDADEKLVEAGVVVNQWIGGVTGPARGPANFFTASSVISEFWQTSTAHAFTVTTSDGEGYYWRIHTSDRFDGLGWDPLQTVERQVEAGEDLRPGAVDEADPLTRRQVTLTVQNVALLGRPLVAPDTPIRVDRGLELVSQGDVGPYFSAKVEGDFYEGDQYTVTSLVPQTEGPNAVTANQLAAAGTRYGGAWIDRYTDIIDGSVGPQVEQEAAAIVNRLPAADRDPYHIAQAIQDYLHDPSVFTYTTDMLGVCAGENKVDCLLRSRMGFCEYFASTMVMMLRTQGIPARYVRGYLPGQPFADFSWRVDASAAHAWVEVYFPDYGWIKFDPTPGNFENGQEPTILAAGDPVAPPSPVTGLFPPGQLGEIECDELVCPDEEGNFPPGSVTPVETLRPPDLLAPIVLGMLVLALLVVLVVAALRRIPDQPEQAYRGVERIARRFGHGARPSQTVYEYADDLAELLPRVRNELQVVATAKVQATYAPGGIEGELLESMRRAYRRLRIALLRLLVRRPRLGRSPRSLGPK
jgi:hypothetical protein